MGVWVSGVPMQALGYVGDVSWTHRAEGGCWEASWAMGGLARKVAHPLLKRGAQVKITVGGWPVWLGILDEPGASMESFTARGLCREAERFMALDAAGASTNNTLTAITEAITRGLSWVTYDTPPAGVPSEEAERLHELLDISATAASKRWGVDPHGHLYFRADPTVPSLHVYPGTPLMGAADDDYVTHVYGRYVSAVSGTPPVPSAWAIATAATDVIDANLYGRSERFVDLTERGLLSASTAENVVAGMLALTGPRVGFSERVDVEGLRLVQARGGHVPLPFLQAGGLCRVHGAVSPGQSATGETYLDFVVGETSYSLGSSSITLAPVGLAPRTLSDVLAATPKVAA